jgi:HEAT repeat protein
MAAIEALWRSADARIIPRLAPLLADPSSGVRWRAALALGRLKDPAAIPLLAPLLADPGGEWVSARAARTGYGA